MAQIGLMRKIYRKAERVWVWLGLPEHQELVSQAVATFNRSARAGRHCKGLQHDKPLMASVIRSYRLDNLEPALWSTVMHIMDNEWFRRV
jgi:hypothetical protein